jgi:hypothetical protein
MYSQKRLEKSYPGALNVKINRKIEIQPNFRISGAEIGEPRQDLLFENCLINGIKAYRIRPLVLETGGGGHGDDTLEIASASYVPNAKLDSEVEVTFFRPQRSKRRGKDAEELVSRSHLLFTAHKSNMSAFVGPPAVMIGERTPDNQQAQFRDNELNRLETMITNGFPKHRSQIADLIAAIEKDLS